MKLSQRQVLTPALMQMVSVLALNKLELAEMVTGEVVENPLLEMEECDAQPEPVVEEQKEPVDKEKDPLEEMDLGSYFGEYLDAGGGARAGMSMEEMSERPSFENFLSKPTTLTDHLLWQLGSLDLEQSVRAAAEMVVGNLEEDGFLRCADEELAGLLGREWEDDAGEALREGIRVVQGLDPAGVGARTVQECLLLQLRARRREQFGHGLALRGEVGLYSESHGAGGEDAAPVDAGSAEALMRTLAVAEEVVLHGLALVERKDWRGLAKSCDCSETQIQESVELIRGLDPRPGLRYNRAEARLIEPDVAIVKRGDEWVVVMNEEGMPQLRMNRGYRRMLAERGTAKEVREYLKERYRSAVQLLRNLEQRKRTIVKVCEVIARRQGEFLERGVEGLRPMMIKDVAEEIGVHASTVSRAVSNKYVHTPQGVQELRYFFSEGGSGAEGAQTPLVLLKRRVKSLIEEEDKGHPLTDEKIAAALAGKGIQVTRRTVAKYREDLRIPSTHQRRARA